MAKQKKQEVPKHIQAKFKKPQFKPGDFVCMTWLGEFIRGELIETYKTHEHVRYKIKAAGFTYTCGIQIGDYKSEHTDYGVLLAGATTAEGIATAVVNENKGRRVLEESGRTDASISNQTTSVGSDSNSNDRSNTTSTSRKSNATKNAANRSTSHDTKKKSKSVKRKNTELEQAIQRQKDFLNGFTN